MSVHFTFVIARTLNIIMPKSDLRVVGSKLNRSIWLFPIKIIQNCRIDDGNLQNLWLRHQTNELDKNHEFYVFKSWNLQFRSLSEDYIRKVTICMHYTPRMFTSRSRCGPNSDYKNLHAHMQIHQNVSNFISFWKQELSECQIIIHIKLEQKII
jgi:UDP-galactopyranose mutase